MFQTTDTGLANRKQRVDFAVIGGTDRRQQPAALIEPPVANLGELSLDSQPVAGHVSAAAVAVSPDTLRWVK